MFRVFKVILALTQLATALRHLHSLGPSRTETLSPKNVVRIYNRQSLLGMDNSGVFGTDYFGLKFSSRPSCAARGLWVCDAATGRVRVRAFRLDRATGGRVDVASGVGP